MIIIQLMLVIAFLIILFRLLVNHNSYQIKALTKIFGVIFVFLAIGVVLSPNSANTVAHWFGVTRGADLLLYVLTLAFISAVLNLYIKEKQEDKRIVALARKVAILDAELQQKLK
jgi:hypothetical protein